MVWLVSQSDGHQAVFVQCARGWRGELQKTSSRISLRGQIVNECKQVTVFCNTVVPNFTISRYRATEVVGYTGGVEVLVRVGTSDSMVAV